MRWTLLAMLCLVGCSDDDGQPDASLDAGVQDTSTAEASTLPDAGEPPRDADVPFVCDVVAPTSCSSPAPKFADVQPIFTKQCGVCHGQDWTGEWPLDNYSHIADWQDEIRSELVSCAMPPPDSGVLIPLADRMKILHWLRCGLPR